MGALEGGISISKGLGPAHAMATAFSHLPVAHGVLTGEWDIPTYRRAHLAATCAPWGEPSEVLFAAAHRLRDDQLERARFVEHAVELLRGRTEHA